MSFALPRKSRASLLEADSSQVSQTMSPAGTSVDRAQALQHVLAAGGFPPPSRERTAQSSTPFQARPQAFSQDVSASLTPSTPRRSLRPYSEYPAPNWSSSKSRLAGTPSPSKQRRHQPMSILEDDAPTTSFARDFVEAPGPSASSRAPFVPRRRPGDVPATAAAPDVALAQRPASPASSTDDPLLLHEPVMSNMSMRAAQGDASLLEMVRRFEREDLGLTDVVPTPKRALSTRRDMPTPKVSPMRVQPVQKPTPSLYDRSLSIHERVALLRSPTKASKRMSSPPPTDALPELEPAVPSFPTPPGPTEKTPPSKTSSSHEPVYIDFLHAPDDDPADIDLPFTREAGAPRIVRPPSRRRDDHDTSWFERTNPSQPTSTSYTPRATSTSTVQGQSRTPMAEWRQSPSIAASARKQQRSAHTSPVKRSLADERTMRELSSTAASLTVSPSKPVPSPRKPTTSPRQSGAASPLTSSHVPSPAASLHPSPTRPMSPRALTPPAPADTTDFGLLDHATHPDSPVEILDDDPIAKNIRTAATHHVSEDTDDVLAQDMMEILPRPTMSPWRQDPLQSVLSKAETVPHDSKDPGLEVPHPDAPETEPLVIEAEVDPPVSPPHLAHTSAVPSVIEVPGINEVGDGSASISSVMEPPPTLHSEAVAKIVSVPEEAVSLPPPAPMVREADDQSEQLLSSPIRRVSLSPVRDVSAAGAHLRRSLSPFKSPRASRVVPPSPFLPAPPTPGPEPDIVHDATPHTDPVDAPAPLDPPSMRSDDLVVWSLPLQAPAEADHDVDDDTSLADLSASLSASSHSRAMMLSRPRPTSCVEISSLDSQAAARAAALLKVHHKYIQEGWLGDSDMDYPSLPGASTMPSLPDLFHAAESELQKRPTTPSMRTPHVPGAFLRTPRAESVPTLSAASLRPQALAGQWSEHAWAELDRHFRTLISLEDEDIVNSVMHVDVDQVILQFLEDAHLEPDDLQGDWALTRLYARVPALQARFLREWEQDATQPLLEKSFHLLTTPRKRPREEEEEAPEPVPSQAPASAQKESLTPATKRTKPSPSSHSVVSRFWHWATGPFTPTQTASASGDRPVRPKTETRPRTTTSTTASRLPRPATGRPRRVSTSTTLAAERA